MSYEISAGLERPEEVIAGYLEDGQHIIKGQARKTNIRVGVYGIPNSTFAWGKRLIDGKIPKDKAMVEVDDPMYKGEIEFLPWGTKGGYQIKCRWVRGYNTLDEQYQDLRLKVVIKENDDFAALIQFQQGYNTFDDTSDAALVQFLKIHYMNDDSVFKSPNAEGSMYKEIRKAEELKKQSAKLDTKFEAMYLVQNASDSEASLKNLFNIIEGAESEEQKVDKNDPVAIFTFLKILADESPEIFMTKVSEYKKNASNVIEKCKVFNVFDLTKDGTIAVIENNKANILIDGINDKGEKMLDWLFENFLTPKAFDAIYKLKSISDKLK